MLLIEHGNTAMKKTALVCVLMELIWGPGRARLGEAEKTKTNKFTRVTYRNQGGCYFRLVSN